MALGWASQESLPDREVARRVVAHVLYPKDFEAAPVRPKYVIAFRSEDGSLYDLCPSLQVPKPLELSDVPYQVNKTKLCK